MRLTSIRVRGCRVHNLKGIDVEIPHGAMTVVTGVSGSGKSSLAFDTVFAEGRRRYLESLSAYARQFVEEIPRPDVDMVEGLPPTVSLDQRSTRGGTRQTVASMCEVLDFLRLLWARLGTRHCEQCGKPVTATSPEHIVDTLAARGRKLKRRTVHLLAPMVRRRKGFHTDVFDMLSRLGMTTARVDGAALPVEPPPKLSRYHEHSIEALVASAAVESRDRDALRKGVDAALDRGGGTLYASFDADLSVVEVFSSTAACVDCGTAYGPLDPAELSWSTKTGMCRTCNGRGVREKDDDDAEADVCRSCGGARLSPAARAVRFRGKGLHEFLAMPIGEARTWLGEASPRDARERAVLLPVLAETSSRLAFVEEVGLSYLTLDRPARTLSGGEAQRVRLAAQLGTGLRGVCYVLDEPTIGLHATDNARLLRTLRSLRDRGATLLVVEHDEDTIRAADHVIDLGPGAGVHGGRVVAVGSPAELAASPASVTGPWLSGARRIDTPGWRLETGGWRNDKGQTPAHSRARPASPPASSLQPALLLRGVTARNLKGIDVRFPLNALTCVTGVSGSGKSTLVRDVLHPALLRALKLVGPVPGAHASLSGAESITAVLEIDQSPIGKTSRSVPATYTGIMDPLREMFAETPEAKMRGFTASRFSFNAKEGACRTCNGQGRVTVEMNFLPDVAVPCEACGGGRFDEETLAVRFLGRTIAEALALPVSEARPVFASFPKIARVLDVMDEVGLGYLELGQASTTLSGGEAQRVKLATEIAKRRRGSIVYLLDEPTTGLHLADVEKLVAVLRSLVELGNTVVVIEHQLDVIACADWVIDLGPGGGAAGGHLVASGTPAEVARVAGSATGACLREKRERVAGSGPVVSP